MIDVNLTYDTGSDAFPVAKILACGDSTIAAYLEQNAVSGYLFNADDRARGCFCFTQAVPGQTIDQQKALFITDPNKARYDAVIVQIGLNDLDPNEDAEIALARYQSFIDVVRAQGRTDVKIIVATMTPCKSRLTDPTLYGPIAGLVAYQKWLDMNDAIMGNGANAIDSVDYRTDIHTGLLNDGEGNLAPEFEIEGINDHIHENNAGREIIGSLSWKNALAALSLYRSDTDFFVPNADELLFDNIYYGGRGLKTGGVLADNGESVLRIPDYKSGEDLIYRGLSTPVFGKPPYLIDDKFIVFNNQPQTQYTSDEFVQVNPPYSAFFVMRLMPGQPYEAFSGGGRNGNYFGMTEFEMRIINASYGLISNPSGMAPKYMTALYEVRVNTGNTATLLLNGVVVGTVPFQGGDINNVWKNYNEVGVITNSADFNFAALYVKKGAFNDAQKTQVNNALIAKWSCGTFPNEVLLSNIQINKVGSEWIPTFVVDNRSGRTLKPDTQWNYIWRLLDTSIGLGSQPIIGTSKTLPVSAYPSGPGYGIKCDIQPVAVDGHIWGQYISGQFKDTQ